jgi:hypothetical protein
MAGGPFAQEIACLECLGERRVTRAIRIHEGVESDQYRCEEGHLFGVDYRRGPATEPQWPPHPDLIAALHSRDTDDLPGR